MRGPWWRRQLYNTGFRLTNPREVVIGILNKTDKHLSAEEIYVKALSIYPPIGLTTVYRTLDLLTQLGIVQKFDFGDGKARYELIGSPEKKEHHHHLICINCNTVIDFTDFMWEESELMEKIEKSLSEKHNFKIMNHTVNFYGLCEKCQKRI